MRHLKIGIRLASLRQPFRQALHTAAQLGAQAVEIDLRGELNLRDFSQTGVRHLRKMLDDLNLRVCAVTFRTRRGYDVAEDLEARINGTKRAMTAAYQLGASVVINQVGTVPAEESSPEWHTLLEALTDLGRYGQHVGAFLAAETGTEDGATLLRLIEALPDGSLAVNFNPGNLIVHGFSAHEAALKLAPHIIHVHATDGVRDLARGRGLQVPLGRGSVDFPELMGVLEEHRYRGYYTIDREQADDPLGEVAAAVQYLQHLVRS